MSKSITTSKYQLLKLLCVLIGVPMVILLPYVGFSENSLDSNGQNIVVGLVLIAVPLLLYSYFHHKPLILKTRAILGILAGITVVLLPLVTILRSLSTRVTGELIIYPNGGMEVGVVIFLILYTFIVVILLGRAKRL